MTDLQKLYQKKRGTVRDCLDLIRSGAAGNDYVI